MPSKRKYKSIDIYDPEYYSTENQEETISPISETLTDENGNKLKKIYDHSNTIYYYY